MQVFGSPIQKMLKFLPNERLSEIPIIGAGFVPPISVDVIANAAISAAFDTSIEGIMDVWEIAKYNY